VIRSVQFRWAVKPRVLPEWRCLNEAALSELEPTRQRVENAATMAKAQFAILFGERFIKAMAA
jgi:hypothetical protein